MKLGDILNGRAMAGLAFALGVGIQFLSTDAVRGQNVEKSTPAIAVPNGKSHHGTGSKASALVAIRYADGRIVDIAIIRSSGNASLDAAIKRHVMGNFRVKAGAGGRVFLPVGVCLSPGKPVPP